MRSLTTNQSKNFWHEQTAISHYHKNISLLPTIILFEPFESLKLASRHRGRRLCLHFMVAAAWLGINAVAIAQTDQSSERLRVPIRALKTTQAQEMIINIPGYVSSRPSLKPLDHYQKSRLGRWEVERDVDSGDPVIGVELKTPAGPIRIRYEVMFDGKPFREERENTIDDLMKIARGEELDEEADGQSNAKARMIAYAKSRGKRATRHELRRRVADFAGGPALLRTSSDLSSDRKETHILFALLDTNEDSVISKNELTEVEAIFDRCDLDVNNRVDLMELHSRLKPRSARRVNSGNAVSWQQWDAIGSEHIDNLSVKVTFNESEAKSNQLLDNCVLVDPWKKQTAEMVRLEQRESCGQAILLSHPTVTIALTAAEETVTEGKATGQVSVGVLAEGNTLFRHLDRDGNWELSRTEFRKSRDRIFELDRNNDEQVDVSELPVLLHVTIARGAVAHRSLQEYVTYVPSVRGPKGALKKLTPPGWFVSMDQDGDRMLTRDEFLGGRDAFDKLDKDENQRLSVEEAKSSQTE